MHRQRLDDLTISLRFEEFTVRLQLTALITLLLITAPFTSTIAETDRFQETIEIFKNAGESGRYFDDSHAYAVFPSVGRAGIGVGGARGTGRVFRQGEYVDDTTMTQLTAGLQLGAQGYRKIVFLEDERAFNEVTSGYFAFSAQDKAVAITAAAGATASTGGTSAGASGGQRDAATLGGFHRGMATSTVACGGLMYEASIGGARFSFRPL